SDNYPNCNWDGTGTAPTSPNPCMSNPHVPPGQGQFTWSYNADKAITRGVEFGTSFPLAEGLKLSTNYTFTYSRLTTGGVAVGSLAQTPKHAAHVKLDWLAN